MDFLDEIAPCIRQAIANGFYEVSEPRSPFPHQSFVGAIESRRFSVIPVIEHRSPVEKKLFDGDVDELVSQLAGAGAHALSVVCEQSVFRGDLADVECAKRSGLPVLYKDFVINSVQIKVAKHSGADAVLLILSLFDKELTDLSLDEAIALCHESGLETLLEVFTLEEFNRAKDSKSDLLGINNRNLKTLTVNLAATQDILSRSKPDRPVISESGVRTRADVLRLSDTGANGVLVGTVILKSPEPASKLRELMGGKL